jgi:hypothetical protein
VFPEPGSRTALPGTQVTFRGIAPSAIGSVTVTGSVSGAHPGRLEADSDDRGASFVPSTAFRAGETVTVHTSMALRGGTAGSYSFTVATPAVETTTPAVTAFTPSASPTPSPTVAPHSTFVTQPTLKPPVLTVTTDRPAADQGLVALATKGAGLPAQLMLLDSDGRLVWDQPMTGANGANDLNRQTYDGHPVLTWWQGTTDAVHGYGFGVGEIVDTSYRPVATVRAGNGAQADLHEFQLTAQNTALVTAYTPIRWDLRSVGGPANGIVLDGVVQEIDVKTGLVLFQWDALDHVPLSTSVLAPPRKSTTAWDYFHVNSIDVGPGNTLLVSARHTGALYDVDRTTGNLIWTLGGKASDFTIPTDAHFSYQHDARWHKGHVITLFDDGGGPPRTQPQSEALRLKVDVATHSVTLLQADVHDPPVVSSSQGDAQQLPNGDTLVGWGDQPRATEFTPSGHVVWDMTYPTGVSSYRAYKVTWTPHPTTVPTIALTTVNGRRMVAVSWNGDTRTRRWKVIGGVTRPKTGFETDLPVGSAPQVQVEALSATGRVLAVSAALRS